MQLQYLWHKAGVQPHQRVTLVFVRQQRGLLSSGEIRAPLPTLCSGISSCCKASSGVNARRLPAHRYLLCCSAARASGTSASAAHEQFADSHTQSSFVAHFLRAAETLSIAAAVSLQLHPLLAVAQQRLAFRNSTTRRGQAIVSTSPAFTPHYSQAVQGYTQWAVLAALVCGLLLRLQVWGWGPPSVAGSISESAAARLLRLELTAARQADGLAATDRQLTKVQTRMRVLGRDSKAPLRQVQVQSAEQADVLVRLAEQSEKLGSEIRDTQRLLEAVQGVSAKQFTVLLEAIRRLQAVHSAALPPTAAPANQPLLQLQAQGRSPAPPAGSPLKLPELHSLPPRQSQQDSCASASVSGRQAASLQSNDSSSHAPKALPPQASTSVPFPQASHAPAALPRTKQQLPEEAAASAMSSRVHDVKAAATSATRLTPLSGRSGAGNGHTVSVSKARPNCGREDPWTASRSSATQPADPPKHTEAEAPSPASRLMPTQTSTKAEAERERLCRPDMVTAAGSPQAAHGISRQAHCVSERAADSAAILDRSDEQAEQIAAPELDKVTVDIDFDGSYTYHFD